MNKKLKKAIKDRSETITNNQLKVYKKIYKLIMQSFHASMVRDVMRDYRYLKATKTKSYNAINSFSHVALENYVILQLWKLFDKKNSVFHVWDVVNYISHKSLKSWFNIEIKKIDKDIRCFSAWRGSFTSHRSKIGYFAPKEFEKKFKDLRKSEQNLRSFLLLFLCKIKFEMQQIEIHKTMKKLYLELQEYSKFLQSEKSKVLK